MFVTRKVQLKYQNAADPEAGSDNGGTGAGTPNEGAAGAEGGKQETGEEGVEAEKKPAAPKPTDAEARLLKENMQKKEQLKKAQSDLAELRARFDGIDPDAVRQLLQERKEAETKELEAKGDYERLRMRMAEEHSKDAQKWQEQLKEANDEVAKMRETIKELTVGTKFSQSKFISDELTLTPSKARVIYGDYFDVEEGKIVGYDKPRGAANRTALVDQYGNPVEFDQALRKLVEADPEKDHLIKATVRPGAGSDTRKTAAAPKTEKFDSNIDRIASGLKGLSKQV